MRTGEDYTEKVIQNLSLERCVGYRLMEIGEKSIAGYCIKAEKQEQDFSLIALEKENYILSIIVSEILTLQSTIVQTHFPALLHTQNKQLPTGGIQGEEKGRVSMERGVALVVKQRELCGQEDKPH